MIAGARLVRYSWRAAMVAGAVVLVAGCGGGSKSTSGTTAASAPSATSPSSASTSPPASTAPAGADTAAQLSAISASINAGKGATFKAVYTYSPPTGQSQTITFEQAPPKSYFSAGQGKVISNGSVTDFCSSGSSAQCVSIAGADPLAGLLQLFSPATANNAIEAAETAVGAHAAGYNVTFSGATFAGQSAKCADISGPAGSGKYCVTDSGILAYVHTADVTFQLSSYSSSVSAGDFTLPSGATNLSIPSVSLPSGVTIP